MVSIAIDPVDVFEGIIPGSNKAYNVIKLGDLSKEGLVLIS